MDRKAKEKKGMTAEEIRAMREEERINSVFPEERRAPIVLRRLLEITVSVVTAAALVAGLFYLNRLTAFLNAYALPYLWMIGDSSGYLAELLHSVIRLLVVALVCCLFGFALEINFSKGTRPKEVWQKPARICLWVAFGSDVLYALGSRLLVGRPEAVTGSVFSQIMYYFTKIAVVPAANVLLFLVLPSAIMKILVTLASESHKRIELPLILTSTVTLTLGMLGMTWSGVKNAGWLLVGYALLQSAACSVLYHRTNNVRRVILLYAAVTALYYPLAWLLRLV